MISKFRNEISCGKTFRFLAFCSFFFIWLCGHSLTWAQGEGYPSKPVKIVVPYSAGGGADLVMRALAGYLGKELGVPIIIENKSGADGMIGAATVLKAKPDGYTLLVASDAPMIHGPLGSPNPPYDPLKDFLIIGGTGVTPHVFTVPASSPFKTIGDLVSEAKRNPGRLSVGTNQIDGRLKIVKFEKVAAIDLTFVPFASTAEIVSAVLGKHIDMMVLTYAASRPYIDAGELRILLTNYRLPGRSAPTPAEAGYPDAEIVVARNGLAVSAKTPKPIHEKLVAAFERAHKNPELLKKWDKIGLIADYKNPTDFFDDMKKKWNIEGELVRELGLTPK